MAAMVMPLALVYCDDHVLGEAVGQRPIPLAAVLKIEALEVGAAIPKNEAQSEGDAYHHSDGNVPPISLLNVLKKVHEVYFSTLWKKCSKET